jgi:hypothetical protein
VAGIVVALLALGGAGQAASKADVSVSVFLGSQPGTVDWQLADASFPGLSSVRFLLQGQAITSITCPSGWTSQVSPTSGAVCGGGTLGPGQTMGGQFTFGGTLPPTAGTLFVGNSTGSEQVPFTISGGTPTPCTCLSVKASIDPKSIEVEALARQPVAKINFTVDWTLNCSPGSGGDCVASLAVVPEPGFHWVERIRGTFPHRIKCDGTCGRRTTGKSKVSFEMDFALGTHVRDAPAGRHLKILVYRNCGTKPGTDEVLSLAFDHLGRPNLHRSKLHP